MARSNNGYPRWTILKVPAICADIDSPAGFYQEVRDRISREERILEKVSRSHRGYWIGHFVALAMLGTITAIMLYRPDVVLIWFIASFLLFSFNFLILLFPTTRREGDGGKCRRVFPGKIVLPMLKEKKKVAIEVGLTMFLGGMVPLALSFFIIFGLGLLFALYFGFVVEVFDRHFATVVVIQAAVIMLFFIILILIHPQSQGISRIAADLKRRIVEARSRSTVALVAVTALIALFAAIVGTVSAWAILVTGGTLSTVISMGNEMGVSILVLSVVLIGEVVVMRHFQSVMSGRMARGLIRDRVATLRRSVLAPLDALVNKGESFDPRSLREEELDRIKARYFSYALYEVIELNFFGFSPVYIVGPDIRYLLDERVLPYISSAGEIAVS